MSRELVKDPVAVSFLEFRRDAIIHRFADRRPAGIPADRLKSIPSVEPRWSKPSRRQPRRPLTSWLNFKALASL
jgi:hypothetical protein